MVLGAKEGLALINGTQVMTAIAALGVLRCERLAAAADVIAAMSLEAISEPNAFSIAASTRCARIPGQSPSHDNLQALLAGSEIVQSHAECGRVQDPYSFRCIPVVHGAVRDSIAHVAASPRRGQLGYRQSAGLSRRWRVSFPAATFTASRSRSRSIS